MCRERKRPSKVAIVSEGLDIVIYSFFLFF